MYSEVLGPSGEPVPTSSITGTVLIVEKLLISAHTSNRQVEATVACFDT